MKLAGRKKIFVDTDYIDESNVELIVGKILAKHIQNAAEEEYLFKYERGLTPILDRDKKGRTDVNYKINENHATEIKTFKVGYVFSSPITLVQRAVEDNEQSDKDDKRIAKLNEMFFEQRKAMKDKQLAEDFTICGVGYRMALPKRTDDGGISPFDILPLNPLTTCVAYFNNVYCDVAIGITFVVHDKQKISISAYTADRYFELEGGLGLDGLLDTIAGVSLLRTSVNGIGAVPIVEYIADEQRMGCFERVLDLLDALDVLESDRVNAVTQYVNNILWLDNVDVTSEQKEDVKNGGWMVTKSDGSVKATVKFLHPELNQADTQTAVNYIYDQVLQITGVPARGKSTGGNTGQAIVLSNGWSIAETAAKNTESIYKDSEFKFLEIILRILKRDRNVDRDMQTLRLSDIDIKFSRNKTDSLLVKVQALQGQLDAGIEPLTAIKTCDLYSDPQQVWIDSKPYIESVRETEINNNNNNDAL